MNTRNSTIFFPGSFDPFTRGHANLVSRALALFDTVIIAVGINEQKDGCHDANERIEAIRRIYNKETRVRVMAYSGLTAEAAVAAGAAAILRGVRSMKDYEYELQMADVNRHLAHIDTVVLFAEPQFAAISSSLVRELAHFGRDISEYLPTAPTEN